MRLPRLALRASFAALLGTLLSACPDTDCVRPPDPPHWRFYETFEGLATFAALFPSDTSGWTNVQLVEPDGTLATVRSSTEFRSGSNRIALDSTRSFHGRASLRFEAPPSGSSVSKAALVKEGVDFRPGDFVQLRCQVFLDPLGDAENAFLVDFESTEVPGFPGRRLALSTGEVLMLESKGSGGPYGAGPNFRQPDSTRAGLPKGRWVDLRLQVVFDRGANGSVDLWQDDTLLLHATGQTFPTEAEVTRFDWFEIGLTANSSTSAQRLWLDDVDLVRIR